MGLVFPSLFIIWSSQKYSDLKWMYQKIFKCIPLWKRPTHLLVRDVASLEIFGSFTLNQNITEILILLIHSQGHVFSNSGGIYSPNKQLEIWRISALLGVIIDMHRIFWVSVDPMDVKI